VNDRDVRLNHGIGDSHALAGAPSEQDRPGRTNADSFFATDIPAQLRWRFGREDARQIGQLVLYIGVPTAGRGSPGSEPSWTSRHRSEDGDGACDPMARRRRVG
jgi:hypothetical protein